MTEIEGEPVQTVQDGDTQIAVETIKTPEEAKPAEEKTQKEVEPSLTKEQKSKLDSFDRIYGENKEMKEKLKSLGVKPAEEEIEPAKDVEEWVGPKDPLEMVKFGKLLQKYSDDETEFILTNAPSKDIDGIQKALANPMVQAAIEGMRKKVEEEDKVPSPSSPSEAEAFVDAAKTVKEGKELEEVAKRYKDLETKGRGVGI